jgi:hypothetical protein
VSECRDDGICFLGPVVAVVDVDVVDTPVLQLGEHMQSVFRCFTTVAGP